MKNKETLARRSEAVNNIPKGWKKRPRTMNTQDGDKCWNPINESFVSVKRLDIGRTAGDFYCIILKSL